MQLLNDALTQALSEAGRRVGHRITGKAIELEA